MFLQAKHNHSTAVLKQSLGGAHPQQQRETFHNLGVAPVVMHMLPRHILWPVEAFFVVCIIPGKHRSVFYVITGEHMLGILEHNTDHRCILEAKNGAHTGIRGEYIYG